MIRKQEIEQCLKNVIDTIYAGDFKNIEGICKEERFPAKFVLEEIESYPGTITYPPSIKIDEKQIMKKNEDDVFVMFDLWFDNKESDLTLTIQLTRKNKDLSCYIHEIHVH